MLSRFHYLFVYLVVGLAVSAAAKPTGQTSDSNAVLPKKFWQSDVGKRGSYDQYPEPQKNSTYSKPADKGKPGSYELKGNTGPYESKGSTGACSVGPQQCCNQAISSHDEKVPSLLGGLDLKGLKLTDILSILEGTDTESIMGTDCSPYDGDIGCDAQPLCCNNNEFNGLIAIGCSPIALDFP